MYVCITFMYDSNVKPTLCMSHLQRATKGVCMYSKSCYIVLHCTLMLMHVSISKILC